MRLKIGFLNIQKRDVIKNFIEKKSSSIVNTYTKYTNINESEIFYENIFFESYLNKQIKIYEHPIIFEIIKRMDEEDSVSVRIWNLTHSNKIININGDKVEKILIGKDGEGKLQYLTKASCIVEMTIKEYNEMIINLTDNKKEINRLLGENDLENIKKQIDSNWEEYSYSNYLNKSIQPYINRWKNENELKGLIDYKKEEE